MNYYLYVDNFRGFADTCIPISDVNFFEHSFRYHRLHLSIPRPHHFLFQLVRMQP